MLSTVDICNLAIATVRVGTINSLDEPSLAAQQCKLRFAHLRDQVLREAPWGFSHKITPLALTTREVFNWAYVYQYPNDCLYINRLLLNIEEIQSGGLGAVSRRRDPELREINLRQQVRYEVINQDGEVLIVSNESCLRVDYRARITDTTKFDTSMAQALIHLLGSELAIPLVGGPTGRRMSLDNLQLYRRYLDAAIAATLNEASHPIPESDFINVRS